MRLPSAELSPGWSGASRCWVEPRAVQDGSNVVAADWGEAEVDRARWMRRYLRSRSPAQTVAPRRGHSLSLRASRRLGLVWEGPTRDPVMVLLLGFAERHGDEQATLQSLRDAAIFEVTQRLTRWERTMRSCSVSLLIDERRPRDVSGLRLSAVESLCSVDQVALPA